MVKLVTLAILTSVSSGSATSRTLTSPEAAYLTPTRRLQLESLVARNGDAEAAFELGYYYEASAFDRNNALRWFRIAKKHGDQGADFWIKAISSAIEDDKRFADRRAPESR